MVRIDEQEIPSISDELPPAVKRFENSKKKPTKEQIAKAVLPVSTAYRPLSIPHRDTLPSVAAQGLTEAQKCSPYELFLLFFPAHLMKKMAEYTNEQAELKKAGEYSENKPYSRPWEPTWGAEIGFFLGILLFKCVSSPRSPKLFTNYTGVSIIYIDLPNFGPLQLLPTHQTLWFVTVSSS